jgi:hypothetical protein
MRCQSSDNTQYLALLLEEVYHHDDLTFFMKKTFALFFVLPLFAVGCQGPEKEGFTDQMPAQVTDTQETAEVTDTAAQSSVKHYEGSGLSFDYPGDLLIFETSHGEGSSGYELTFIKSDDGGVYTYAGPMITVEDSENSPTHLEKYQQDLQKAGQTAKVLDFSGAQAFEVSVTNDFSGEHYKTLEFIFDNPSYDSSTKWLSPYAFATFLPADVVSGGARYQEILDLFEQTVSFQK